MTLSVRVEVSYASAGIAIPVKTGTLRTGQRIMRRRTGGIVGTLFLLYTEALAWNRLAELKANWVREQFTSCSVVGRLRGGMLRADPARGAMRLRGRAKPIARGLGFPSAR